MGGITDVVNDAFNKITVEKSLVGGTNIGDTVTTTIKIKFPSSTEKNSRYVLTDVVPTGMRYTGYSREYNSNYYLKGQEVQKLYFVLNNKDNSDITITYTARNLLPGEYFVDSAVVENIKENIRGYSVANSYAIEKE